MTGSIVVVHDAPQSLLAPLLLPASRSFIIKGVLKVLAGVLHSPSFFGVEKQVNFVLRAFQPIYLDAKQFGIGPATRWEAFCQEWFF